MRMKRILRIGICTLILFFGVNGAAQDKRAQYPGLLRKAYFGIEAGSINYPFTNEHLPDGYTSSDIHIPHLALRLTLLGYRFNDVLSARITYMRPINWVEYNDINGDKSRHTIWMNIGGLTLKAQTSSTKKFSAFAEAGLGVITRNGFSINGEEVVKDISYASLLAGGGIQYNLNKKFSFTLSTVYSPERKEHSQPHTIFYSGGFIYNMQPLSEERVKKNSSGGYIFPKNLLQVAYTTNELGYGANDFVSEGTIPIFWGGEAHLSRGVAMNYQRNVFHTRKVFSLDVGTSFGYWKSRIEGQHFYTISVYPMLRFTAIRTKPVDFYFNYSVAGPTYISSIEIDGRNTGKHFTFRDFMGLGMFAGKKRNINAEVNIGHFSNGNIFPDNAGIKIPLSFTVGYAF
jgi:hypothetical protein